MMDNNKKRDINMCGSDSPPNKIQMVDSQHSSNHVISLATYKNTRLYKQDQEHGLFCLAETKLKYAPEQHLTPPPIKEEPPGQHLTPPLPIHKIQISDYVSIRFYPNIVYPWIDVKTYFVYWVREIFKINTDPRLAPEYELVSFYQYTENKSLTAKKLYLYQFMYKDRVVREELGKMIMHDGDDIAMYVLSEPQSKFYLNRTGWNLVNDNLYILRYVYTDENEKMTLSIRHVFLIKPTVLISDIKRNIDKVYDAIYKYMGSKFTKIKLAPVYYTYDELVSQAVEISVDYLNISIVCRTNKENTYLWDMNEFVRILQN